MKRSSLLFLSILSLVAVDAVAGVKAAPHRGTTSPLAQLATSTSAALDPAALESRRLLISQLAGKEDLQLRHADGQAFVNFGVRSDELVHAMTLHVRYMFSPALIPVESHVRVLINDQAVGVLPIIKDRGGDLIEADLSIDPRLLTNFNHISFQFIGHYTNDNCEDPLNNTLWTNIRGDSWIDLSVEHLTLRNDLALLPVPFFDRHDIRQVKIPFIMTGQPSRNVTQAAGIVASWFGKEADWRSVRFPISSQDIPRGQVVVFATNDEKPSFLKDHAPVDGPYLEIRDNPVDKFSKMLILWGRNAEDLKSDAMALAIGRSALSGSIMKITEVKEEAPRIAYDAPRWVRIDRPVKFGEMVKDPLELQVFGHTPGPVTLGARISPDLFAWRSNGIPVDLKFRYTPPPATRESLLVVQINKELVQAFTLLPEGKGGEQRLYLPLEDSTLFSSSEDLYIPPYKLGPRNQLDFTFSFAYRKEGFCKDASVRNQQGMLDDDSTLDLTDFPHYAELPNIGYFTSLGFPFTKFADLQQTVLVLPEQPTHYDLETLFSILARLSGDTGYPATRFTLAQPKDDNLFANADLLVIGDAVHQGSFKNWADKMPAELTASSRRILKPKRSADLFYDWFGFGTQPNPEVANIQQMSGNGPLALMTGFQSPVTLGRSVITINTVVPEQQPVLLDAMDKAIFSNDFHGSVAFIQPQRIDSMLVGPTYYVGHLPFWTAIWFPLSKHPILVGLLAILSVLILSLLVLKALKRIAERRLNGK